MVNDTDYNTMYEYNFEENAYMQNLYEVSSFSR